MKDLQDYDYLEIIDLDDKELAKYSKAQLIRELKDRCHELHDAERRRA